MIAGSFVRHIPSLRRTFCLQEVLLQRVDHASDLHRLVQLKMQGCHDMTRCALLALVISWGGMLPAQYGSYDGQFMGVQAELIMLRSIEAWTSAEEASS